MDNVHIQSFLAHRVPDLQLAGSLLSSCRSIRKRSASFEELKRVVGISTPYRRTGSFRPFKIPRRIKMLRAEQRAKRSEEIASRGGDCVYKRRKVEVRRCRKHMRRPSWLLQQHKQTWLPTHIWHAKRFRMTREFGLSMAESHRGRGVTRKLAVALAERAIVHDASYVAPVELRGPVRTLVSFLRCFTDPGARLFPSPSSHRGPGEDGDSSSDSSDSSDNSDSDEHVNREERTGRLHDRMRAAEGVEQRILLYRYDTFPRDCLGPALLTALPGDSDARDEGSEARVWVWLHPASYGSARAEFVKHLPDALHVSAAEEFQEPLARFSLRGARSMIILRDLLRVTDRDSPEARLFEALGRLPSQRAVQAAWPLDSALALEVQDVRSVSDSPHQKERCDNTKGEKKKQRVTWIENSCRRSPIWTPHGRSSRRLRMATETVFNERRARFRHSRHRITEECDDEKSDFDDELGNDADEASPEVPMPVVIIRKDESLSCGSYTVPALFQNKYSLRGFDLLLPQCYASRLWNALQLQGVAVKSTASSPIAGTHGELKMIPALLPVGCKEMDFLRLQAGIPSFPRDYLETQAGRDYWQRRVHEQAELQAKRPQNNRIDSDGWLVPKFSALLEHDPSSMMPPKANNNDLAYDSYQGFVMSRSLKYSYTFERQEPDGGTTYPKLPVMPHLTCCSTLLVPTSRGVPLDGAEILLPTEDDYKLFLHHKRNKNTEGKWCGAAPCSTREGSRRTVIGLVTSGCSRRASGRQRNITNVSDKRFAMGFCRLDRLNEAHAAAHSNGMPKEETLVLFRNPGRSFQTNGHPMQTLRPALLHINCLLF